MAIPKTSGLQLFSAVREFSEPEGWAELEQLLGLRTAAAEERAAWTSNDWARHDFQMMLKLEALRERPIIPDEQLTAWHRWVQLRAAFKSRLQSGELIASGYVKPVELASKRVEILAEKWQILELNYIDGSASGEGLEIVSIIVRHSNISPTAAAETACRNWIEKIARAGESPSSREALFKEARERFGEKLSERAFYRAWASAAPDQWKRPGRKSARRNNTPMKS